MRIAVTGGAGFIGSHLVYKLISLGHTVIVIDDLRHGLRSNVPEKAGFVMLDIKSPAISEIIERGAFDCIIHLAAQTRVDISIENPRKDAGSNIMGTVNILECAKKYGVKRVIFASTAAVYGDPPIQDLPLEELHSRQPLSFYGLSKMTAEAYFELYHQIFGLEYIIFRFANVYGERAEVDDEGGVINIFAKKTANNLPIYIYGDGSQSRDYIYVGDIVNGIVAALQTKHVNEVYNLSTGQEVTLCEILNILRHISGQTLTPVYKESRSGDIYRSVLSNEKAHQLLSWHPYMTLENGLARTYQYFLDISQLETASQYGGDL